MENLLKISVKNCGNAAGTLYVYNEDVCFTDYPLTPACKEAIEKFIKESVEKFAEWYEVQ